MASLNLIGLQVLSHWMEVFRASVYEFWGTLFCPNSLPKKIDVRVDEAEMLLLVGGSSARAMAHGLRPEPTWGTGSAPGAQLCASSAVPVVWSVERAWPPCPTSSGRAGGPGH